MSATTSMKHTRIPNDLLDKHMADMGVAELKVVLFAMRQTLGYHRTSDAISLSQFVKATGLSRQGVLDGIEAAKKRGMLCEVSRGKRGVVVYAVAVELETRDEKPATSQASRPVKQDDQSSKVTGTGQASRPEKPATSQASRHTKERVLKENFKDKEIKESAHESTPTPFYMQNGLGRTKPSQNPLVLQAKAHPVFQAYVRGRGGIEPQVPPSNAQDMLDTLGAIQADIEEKLYTAQDVEDLVRFKLSVPHSKAYLLSYIKTDIADFVNGRNSGVNFKPPPRAAPVLNGNGKPIPPSTNDGFPGKQAQTQAKTGG